MDDRKALRNMTKFIKGKLFGDKGYISKLLQADLWEQGIELITRVRKNMKPVVLKDVDNILLQKRALIESVNDQLKNISQIQHTRHRSIVNFMVNVIAGLISYSWQEPSLNLRQQTHNNQLLVEHELFLLD